jgi:hypothetical protein
MARARSSPEDTSLRVMLPSYRTGASEVAQNTDPTRGNV